MSYIRGEGVEGKGLLEFFKKEEAAWIDKTREYRLYEEPLKSAAAFYIKANNRGFMR